MPKLHPIILTPLEKKICGTLLKANEVFRLGTTFRIVGGWVRDRLLGKESDDLDVALSNITGKQMEEVLIKMGPNYGIGKSYTIKADVEKSKHLETVAIEIYGQKIDFVNLRSESYGESRVPTMEMGTPLSDCERRDLTINAISYNINTGQIEDLVGGLKDLENMVLRTPLNPRKTLLDDPLRFLRTVRFFSKLPGSIIDPKLIEAMRLPEVHEAYRNKVSSERAGPEIMKLLAGDRPAEALRVLFDTGLDKAVFNVPETQNLLDIRMDQRNKHHTKNLLDHTLSAVDNMDKLMRQENAPDDMRVKMLLSIFFHDYGKSHPEIGKPKEKDPTQYAYIGHEDKSVEIADSIMKSISIPEADRKFVDKIISLHMKPHTKDWTPKAMGRFLRETEIPGQDSKDIWRYVWLHGMADAMAIKEGEPLEADLQTKREMMKQIEELKNRPGPAINKPVLNGYDLMNLFPTLKPDSGFIKEVSEKLLDAQASGIVTDRASAEKHIQEMRQYIEDKYGKKTPPISPVAWVHKNCRFAQS